MYDPTRSVFAGNLPRSVEVRGHVLMCVSWAMFLNILHVALHSGASRQAVGAEKAAEPAGFSPRATYAIIPRQDEDVIRFFSDGSISSELRTGIEAVRVVRDRKTTLGKGEWAVHGGCGLPAVHEQGVEVGAGLHT